MNTLLPMLCWLLCGTISSKIARKKNRNFQAWFFLGMFFGLLALIIIYFLKPLKNSRKGPTNRISKSFSLKSPVLKSSALKRPALDHFSILTKDNNYWYYLDEKRKQKGPMSLNMLYENYLKDLISNTTYVWNDTMKDWTKLQDISFLSKLLKNSTN